MLRETYPYYLANTPVAANTDLVVTNKYTHQPAATIEQAIAAAADAFPQTRQMPGYYRQAVLNHLVSRVEQRHEELAHALVVEVGKPIKDARGEVTRLVDTLRIAAED